MSEITLEKIHALLEKLAEYVMNEVPRKSEVPTKQEMNARFEQVDSRFEQMDSRFEKVEDRIDRLADYVLTEIPGIKDQLEQKADKRDIQIILNGLDKNAKQLDIIRTEQVAFHHAFRRLEKRVEVLET